MQITQHRSPTFIKKTSGLYLLKSVTYLLFASTEVVAGKAENGRFVENLQDEVILHVFSYFSPKEMSESRRVCKLWDKLSNDDVLWRGYLKKYFPEIESGEQRKSLNYKATYIENVLLDGLEEKDSSPIISLQRKNNKENLVLNLPFESLQDSSMRKGDLEGEEPFDLKLRADPLFDSTDSKQREGFSGPIESKTQILHPPIEIEENEEEYNQLIENAKNYLKRREFEEAKKCYKAAERRRPSCITQYHLGRIFVNQGKTKKAVKWLSQSAAEGYLLAQAEVENVLLGGLEEQESSYIISPQQKNNIENLALNLPFESLQDSPIRKGNLEEEEPFDLQLRADPLFDSTDSKQREGGSGPVESKMQILHPSIGIEENEEITFKQLKKAAEQGHAEAQYYLAGMYGSGRGVEKNEELAFNWMLKAAEQGYVTAQWRVGVLYGTGFGVEKNEAEGFNWVEKAAKQQYAEAQFLLGYLYENAVGIKKDERKAFKWVKKAAEQGDANAQYYLAGMYGAGLGVEKNVLKVFAWRLKAAERGHAEAQYRVGSMYAAGVGVEKNEKEAFNWILRAARQRNVDAQFLLGTLYDEGAIVEKDERKACKWVEKAAEQGHIEAQCRVGLMYMTGAGVEKNEEQAFQWMLMAAKQDCAAAQWRVGAMYGTGIGVEKDEAEAFNWVLKAANHNYAEAQFLLGYLYENAIGIKKDEKEAFKWVEKAAEQGHIEAQYRVGSMYANAFGVRKNEAACFKCTLKAAEQGHIEAQYVTGELYRNGIGVHKDELMAFKWIKKAAERGHTYAQCRVGSMYATGFGVEKNEEAAFNWMQEAAEQDCADAQFLLGYLYQEGAGIGKDERRAFRWRLKAAEQGHIEGQYRVGLMYATGIGVEKNEESAFKWTQKAAEQGYAEAQFLLGRSYESGVGVKKDENEAFKWWLKAAEQGHAGAHNILQSLTWKAAERGLAEAQYYLGKMYENKAVSFSVWDFFSSYESRALEWYQRACEQGFTKASTALGWMYARGKGVKKSVEETVKYFRHALKEKDAEILDWLKETDHPLAFYTLGKFYEREQSFDQAVAWHEKAAERNHLESFYRLGELYAPLGRDAEAFKAYTKASQGGHDLGRFALAEMYEEGKGVKFSNPEEKRDAYAQARRLYESLRQGTLSEEATWSCKRVDKLLQGVGKAKGKEERSLSPTNYLFKKLESLSNDSKISLSAFLVEDFKILTEKLLPFREEVQNASLNTLQALCLFPDGTRQAQVIMRQLLSRVDSEEFKDKLCDEERISALEHIERQIHSTINACKILPPRKVPEKLKVNLDMIEDPRIELFNCFFGDTGAKPYSPSLHRRAVGRILALFDECVQLNLIQSDSNVLWNAESQKHGDRKTLKDLLTKRGSPSSQLAHRVIENQKILSGLDKDVVASNLMNWAAAGLECGWRSEEEMSKFYTYCITSGKRLEEERSTLELRVALCLAKLREHLIEKQVPFINSHKIRREGIDDNRIHKVAQLKRITARRLGLIGDIEFSKDAFKLSIGECTHTKPEEVIERVLPSYTEQVMISCVKEEINKRSDSSIPCQIIRERLGEQIRHFYDGEEGIITGQGVRALLYGLGYLTLE